MASGNDELYNQQKRSTQYRYTYTHRIKVRPYLHHQKGLLDVWRVCQMKSVRREGGIQLIEVKYIGHAWKKVKQVYTHKEKEFNWDEVGKNQDEEKKKNRKFWWVSTRNWFHNDDNEKTKEKFTEIRSSLYDLRALEKK